jgi:hypothetical protein
MSSETNDCLPVDNIQESLNTEVETVANALAMAIENISTTKESMENNANAAVTEAKEQATAVVTEVKDLVVQDATKMLQDIKGSVIEMASKSLAETLMATVNPTGIRKDLKIVISKDASNMIASIAASTPAVLDDVKNSLLEIIKDNKIDSSDIPHFIAIIQSLYQIITNLREFKLDNKSKATVCAEVLKYISHFLILDGQIQVEKIDQALLLNQLDNLVDSCTSLLSFPSVIKVKGCPLPFCA